MSRAKYLQERCISDEVITTNKLFLTNDKVTIPVFSKDGVFLFNKYRWFNGNIKYSYDKGGTSRLYNEQNLNFKHNNFIYINEGEFDCCVLQSQDYNSVSSTGGAGSFKVEWLKDYKDKEIKICFDNDKAGIQNAVKLYIELIEDGFGSVGIIELLPVEKLNDVTDYFTQGYSKKFLQLNVLTPRIDLKSREYSLMTNLSTTINPAYYDEFARLKKVEELNAKKKVVKKDYDNDLESIKSVPIEHYMNFNQQKKANCLWHNDKTPSLMINKIEKGRFPNTVHCFSCGFHGSVVDVVMKQLGMSFPEAVNKIKKDFNIK